MKTKYKQEDSVRIAIKNIQLGMFVTAIERSTKVSLEVAGVVSSKKAIQQLIDSGVRYVWVDVGLSSDNCKFVIAKEESKPVETEKPKPTEHPLKKRASKPIDPIIRKEKAKKVITEARGLANRIIQNTFEGNPIDLGKLDAWADNIIDTVIEDADAIKFVSALRKKDTYLLEHSVNVACLLISFGKYLNFEKPVLKQLAIGGMIHDLGKIKVKNKVLNKPGRLTSDEFEHMKLHQVYVSDILDDMSGLSDISKFVCLMHHEKLDGSGYPMGLKEDQLPIYGRMSAIVDIYDALTAERCYKSAMSPSEAFKVLLSMTPHQLDQDLVYKFINCIGVYPVGSVVELNDGNVALVEETERNAPSKPQVKCFYSSKYHKYIEVKSMRLLHSNQKIERGVAPKSLGIDLAPFYD